MGGEVGGIGPEVSKAVLEKMGIKEITWIVTPFSTLIPGLMADRWDMVAAVQTIKPSRWAQVAFSNPTESAGRGASRSAGQPEEPSQLRRHQEQPKCQSRGAERIRSARLFARLQDPGRTDRDHSAASGCTDSAARWPC